MKAIVTDWQLRPGDGEPQVNDHADAAYDARGPRPAGRAPRRRGRLARAARVRVAAARRLSASASPGPSSERPAGDGKYVASPRVDSYHGVWFELHEDLILLAGRTRADEVEAGRA